MSFVTTLAEAATGIKRPKREKCAIYKIHYSIILQHLPLLLQVLFISWMHPGAVSLRGYLLSPGSWKEWPVMVY